MINDGNETGNRVMNQAMAQEKLKKQMIDRLSRIEGQVRGLQKMINEDRYCIDVLTQMVSVGSALRAAEDMVVRQYLGSCVAAALHSGDAAERQEKIDEVMAILSRFRKRG